MLYIIKIGGKIINNNELLKIFFKNFQNLKGKKIIIHGGGIIANKFLKKMGIEPKIINGRRITDYNTLNIIIMTYAGLINKKIVASLQKIGCNALGLSGVDVNLICSTLRISKNINYGYVGDINEKNINKITIKKILNLNFIPVFCSITHDKKGNLLNTNADDIACALAIALSEKGNKINLCYCFEQKGILNNIHNKNSYFKKINFLDFINLKKENIINKGMIPKLENGFKALKKGVYKVSIGHPSSLNKLKDKTILCL